MTTVLSQLVTSETDYLGYITYVFRRLDDDDIRTKYIMCTRYPNWNHGKLELGDKGFLTYEEITAGRDTWYNGTDMIPYKYDAIQFIKFVPVAPLSSEEFVM